jgi:hypothetical protein
MPLGGVGKISRAVGKPKAEEIRGDTTIVFA